MAIMAINGNNKMPIIMAINGSDKWPCMAMLIAMMAIIMATMAIINANHNGHKWQ